MWVKEREWRADGWVDADFVALRICEFFRNLDEFIRAENEVYKIVNS